MIVDIANMGLFAKRWIFAVPIPIASYQCVNAILLQRNLVPVPRLAAVRGAVMRRFAVQTAIAVTEIPVQPMFVTMPEPAAQAALIPTTP